jgi:hypothetical protein
MEELLYNTDGTVDVEGTVEFRETRKVPPNPPPPAAREGLLDGKAIARIAVSECINSGSWFKQAVMQYLISCANQENGACYPSNATIARDLDCSEATVERATRWWREHGYKRHRFLTIAVRGRQRPDGTNESNAYHVGWLPLISAARDLHYRKRIRIMAKAIIEIEKERASAVTM